MIYSPFVHLSLSRIRMCQEHCRFKAGLLSSQLRSAITPEHKGGEADFESCPKSPSFMLKYIAPETDATAIINRLSPYHTYCTIRCSNLDIPLLFQNSPKMQSIRVYRNVHQHSWAARKQREQCARSPWPVCAYPDSAEQHILHLPL
jgi:hypothetical protein